MLKKGNDGPAALQAHPIAFFWSVRSGPQRPSPPPQACVERGSTGDRVGPCHSAVRLSYGPLCGAMEERKRNADHHLWAWPCWPINFYDLACCLLHCLFVLYSSCRCSLNRSIGILQANHCSVLQVGLSIERYERWSNRRE